MRRIKVYIAGPYSADNTFKIFGNIRRGNELAYKLLCMGFAPFSPWLDFLFLLHDHEDELTLQDFYDYSMEWLRVSDVMLVQGDWRKSKGTLEEIKEAEMLGIPIFYSTNDLYQWAYKKAIDGGYIELK